MSHLYGYISSVGHFHFLSISDSSGVKKSTWLQKYWNLSGELILPPGKGRHPKISSLFSTSLARARLKRQSAICPLWGTTRRKGSWVSSSLWSVYEQQVSHSASGPHLEAQQNPLVPRLIHVREPLPLLIQKISLKQIRIVLSSHTPHNWFNRVVSHSISWVTRVNKHTKPRQTPRTEPVS